jgi:hypothetical protein
MQTPKLPFLIILMMIFSPSRLFCQAKNVDSPTTSNVTLLAAANFDFTGKLSTSFLGLFNVFAPNVIKKKYGFDFGIEKINYSTSNINGNDSNQVEFFNQNYLLNPLSVNQVSGTIKPGAKYVQQYNQYTYSSSNRVWSFYVDPLYRISDLGQNDLRKGLFAHFHAELLINQWTRTANIKTLYQSPDTMTTSGNTPTKGYYWVAKNPIVANYNFISAYFGAGLTLLTNLYDTKSAFFCQGTLGWANHTPDFDKLNDPNQLLYANGTYSNDSILNSKTKGFFLLRMNFTQELSSKSQLIIGLHLRGNFSDLNCQYAAFLGLNLDLEAIAKLVTGN